MAEAGDGGAVSRGPVGTAVGPAGEVAVCGAESARFTARAAPVPRPVPSRETSRIRLMVELQRMVGTSPPRTLNGVLATQSGLLMQKPATGWAYLCAECGTSALQGSKSAMDTHVKGSKQHDLRLFLRRARNAAHDLRRGAYSRNPIPGDGEWGIKAAHRRAAPTLHAGPRGDIRRLAQKRSRRLGGPAGCPGHTAPCVRRAAGARQPRAPSTASRRVTVSVMA